jgi:hypothetical protein
MTRDRIVGLFSRRAVPVGLAVCLSCCAGSGDASSDCIRTTRSAGGQVVRVERLQLGLPFTSPQEPDTAPAAAEGRASGGARTDADADLEQQKRLFRATLVWLAGIQKEVAAFGENFVGLSLDLKAQFKLPGVQFTPTTLMRMFGFIGPDARAAVDDNADLLGKWLANGPDRYVAVEVFADGAFRVVAAQRNVTDRLPHVSKDDWPLWIMEGSLTTRSGGKAPTTAPADGYQVKLGRADPDANATMIELAYEPIHKDM